MEMAFVAAVSQHNFTQFRSSQKVYVFESLCETRFAAIATKGANRRGVLYKPGGKGLEIKRQIQAAESSNGKELR